MCDRKRFFGETLKHKIFNLKRWNFTETVITAVRDIFGRKWLFRPKMRVSAENGMFRPNFSSSIMLSSSSWFSRVPLTLYLIKELAPKETFSDKTVYFRPKQPFSAKNYVTAEWPKPANNAETVSAENWPKFRPKLSAVSPFGRTLWFGGLFSYAAFLYYKRILLSLFLRTHMRSKWWTRNRETKTTALKFEVLLPNKKLLTGFFY